MRRRERGLSTPLSLSPQRSKSAQNSWAPIEDIQLYMLGPAPRVLSPFPHTVYAVHGQTCAVSIGPHDSSKAVRDAACEWGLPNGSRVTTAASSASVNATHRLLTLECPAPLLERRSFSHVRGRGGERRRRGTLTISFDHRTTRKADVIFLADIARPPQQASPVVPSRVHFTSLGGRPLSALLCLAVTTAALIWNPEHLILHVDRPPPKDGAFDCVMTFARLSILPAPPARRRPVQSARPGRCGVGPTCSLVDRRLPNGSVSSLVPYSRLRPVHQNDIVRGSQSAGGTCEARTHHLASRGPHRCASTCCSKRAASTSTQTLLLSHRSATCATLTSQRPTRSSRA